MENKNLPPLVVTESTPTGKEPNFVQMKGGSIDFMNDERRYLVIDEPAKIDPEAWKRLEAGVLGATENMVDLADATRKAHEAIERFGPGARVVAPYKPNRKQRRAQNKIRRSKEKKS